jgi:hypothetical protein
LLASSGVALSAVMSMCAKLLVARDICRCSYVRLVSEFESYLMCIVRTGTGTDPLGMCTGTDLTGNAYRYRYRPMKCVSVVAR